jgi:hypothetical protein
MVRRAKVRKFSRKPCYLNTFGGYWLASDLSKPVRSNRVLSEMKEMQSGALWSVAPLLE